MPSYQNGWRNVGTVAIAFCIVIATLLAQPTMGWATGLQTGQFQERSATLIGPREDAPIALYIRPAPNQQPVGYGISGDPVTVFDQFGDFLMEDDPSATWSHIRLEKAPYTEGWLRGRFLSIQPEAPSADPSASAADTEP
ncbi:MAG: hypothetical protein AAFU53_10975 [Cyanobacteria bacterium J06632_3]